MNPLNFLLNVFRKIVGLLLLAIVAVISMFFMLLALFIGLVFMIFGRQPKTLLYRRQSQPNKTPKPFPSSAKGEIIEAEYRIDKD